MEEFNIKVIKKSPIKYHKKFRQPARITIGAFTERFWMPLDYWSIDDYKAQWKEGIERLRHHNSSCLIAKITFSEKELFVYVWMLYKVDDTIVIQYHFLPDEQKTANLAPFDFNTWPLHLRSWEKVNNGQYRFDNWYISVKDFFASWNKQGCKII